jgi:hypothetical protein
MEIPEMVALVLAFVIAIPVPVAAAASATVRAPAACIETRIASVSPYFEGQPDSGWDVSFAGRIRDPYRGTIVPHLTDRSGTDYRALHAGDRVEVCLVEAPAPERGICDPRADPRGRVYRVYDYRLRVAYTALNSAHGCGGA